MRSAALNSAPVVIPVDPGAVGNCGSETPIVRAQRDPGVSMKPKALQWRKVVAKPSAVSFVAWLVAVPALLAVALWGLAISWGTGLLALAGVEIGGLLMMVVTLGATRRWSAVRTWVVYALCGASGVMAAHGLLLLGGQTSQVPLLVSAAVAALMGVLWITAGAGISDGLSRQRQARSEVLLQLARERSLVLQSARLVDQYRERIVRETQELVAHQLSGVMAIGGNPRETASELSRIVDEVVRPLSHELYREEVTEQGLVDTVTAVADPPRLPVRAYLRELADIRGFPWKLGIVLTISAMIAAWPWPVAQVLICLFAVLVAGLCAATSRLAVQVESEAADALAAAEWASGRLSLMAWSEQHRLGRVIHGEAQARIVSAALQMRLHPGQSPRADLDGLARDIQDLLAAPAGELGWSAALDQATKVWGYSLDIEVDADPRAVAMLDADRIAGHAVVEVLREAITNAVRHGEAQAIAIRITCQDPTRIVVEVTDDGRSVREPMGPGLGSATYDAACLSWSLVERSRGHRLHAVIAVGEKVPA